jgi:hypothetical protein
MLQTIIFVSLERSFHLPIYVQKMAHALISNRSTRVPTPRFRRDLHIRKYLDIYASQVDLLVEHGSTDGKWQLDKSLNLFCHLLIILLDLLFSIVVR